ncbi:hypothetical protein KW782_03185 [Candidatus Parcubacteria bacterium]|nr:hypothetical protein [Candidatus Parcubacteria bacterium]
MKEVTLENVAEKVDSITKSIDKMAIVLDSVAEKQEHFDKKLDGFTEIMVDRFDGVYDRLDKIEFNTSGQERRISTLEDKVRIISTKIGLDYNK